MAAIDGTISVRVSSATSSRPSSLVAAIELMITGAALMLSAVTCGSTFSGRPALRRLSVISASTSSTSVPNEKSATTRLTEFAEVDWSDSRRGTPETARSIGSATWSATSSAPAPGYGATIVMTGNSMSGRSSCFRLPQAASPAMNSAPASRSVTLRLETANSVRRLIVTNPFVGRPPGAAAIRWRG